MYKHFIKRAADLIIAFIAAVMLIPVWLILSLLIVIDDRGSVFFVQKRVGKGKKLFPILKFRTMKAKTPHDTPTHLLSDPDQYITRVGRFLRKTSLDELPQLFNIIAGQMAIVGPRPALWNQYDLIEERDKYGANDIRPGLTGLAQINGRDELPIPEKARLDGEYARSVSLKTDISCILGTVSAVLRHRGVVEGGTGTLDKEKNDSEALPDNSGEKP